MSEWTTFRQEVFGDPYLVWHDGADFDEIARRFAADPDLVLRLLALGLSEGDSVAGEAARNLEETDEQRPAIVAMLEVALPASAGAARTEIATSLHALGGPAELAQHLVDVMLGRDHWGVRLDAAIRLGGFDPTPELVAAAAAGVRDRDYLVRFHSANTLMRWAGRHDDVSDDAVLFALIVDDAGPSGWSQAAERLAVAVKP